MEEPPRSEDTAPQPVEAPDTGGAQSSSDGVGSSAAAPAAEAAEILGPGSSQAMMKARLKELHAPTYGSKQAMWGRLVDAEAKKVYEDKQKEFMRRTFEARVAGESAPMPEGPPLPYEPTAQERERHDLGHFPPARWCEACVLGEGVEDPHRQKPVYSADRREELVQFDWAYNGAKDDENNCDEADKKLGASLVMADRSTGWLYGGDLGSKEASDYAAKEINTFLNELAYKSPEIRCDTESAVIALQQKVIELRAKADQETRQSTGHSRDSRSMGFIEVNVRWWRSKLRVYRLKLESNYGIKLQPHHAVWKFLGGHAAFMINRFRVRPDGHTAHFIIYGVNYTGQIVPFGETVIFRVPVDSSGSSKLGVALNKADTKWLKGIWVGKNPRSDDHVVLTPMVSSKLARCEGFQAKLVTTRSFLRPFSVHLGSIASLALSS